MSKDNLRNCVQYQQLLQRARKFGVTCPLVMVRFIGETTSELKRRELVSAMTSLVQSVGIPIIRDFVYRQIVDDQERLILILEGRYGLPADQMFVFLYEKMQLSIGELSCFLDLSTETVISLLAEFAIKRRKDDLVRNIGHDTCPEEVDDQTEIVNEPDILKVDAVKLPALVSSSGDVLVGPLFRTMEASEREHILNARHFYIQHNLFEKAFYMEACMYRLLSLEEVVALAKRIETGDIIAFEHLTLANLRLLFRVANIYYRRFEHKLEGMDLSDLIQEGFFGLKRAVEKYDHSLGYRFSTYALFWIRQAIERGIQTQGSNVYIPINAHEDLKKIRNAQRHFNNLHGYEPSIREIVEMTSITNSRVRNVLGATGGTMRLDRPMKDDEYNGTTFLDQMTSHKPIDPELILKATKLRKELLNKDRNIRQVLSQFPLREQITLCFRFGLFGFPKLSLDEIGQGMHLTRERIRQLEERILTEIGGDPELTKTYITRLCETLEILKEAIIYEAA